MNDLSPPPDISDLIRQLTTTTLEYHEASKRDARELRASLGEIDARLVSLESSGVPELGLKQLRELSDRVRFHVEREDLDRQKLLKEIERLAAKIEDLSARDTQQAVDIAALKAIASRSGHSAGIISGSSSTVILGIAWLVLSMFAQSLGLPVPNAIGTGHATGVMR